MTTAVTFVFLIMLLFLLYFVEKSRGIRESQRSLKEWCPVLIFCRQGCGQYSVSDGPPVYLWAMTVFVLQLAFPPVLLILTDTLQVLVECESCRLQLL